MKVLAGLVSVFGRKGRSKNGISSASTMLAFVEMRWVGEEEIRSMAIPLDFIS